MIPMIAIFPTVIILRRHINYCKIFFNSTNKKNQQFNKYLFFLQDFLLLSVGSEWNSLIAAACECFAFSYLADKRKLVTSANNCCWNLFCVTSERRRRRPASSRDIWMDKSRERERMRERWMLQASARPYFSFSTRTPRG